MSQSIVVMVFVTETKPISLAQMTVTSKYQFVVIDLAIPVKQPLVAQLTALDVVIIFVITLSHSPLVQPIVLLVETVSVHRVWKQLGIAQ